MRCNCRIVTRRVAGRKAYFFLYNATADMSFDFSMLCEVGQPFIPTFERLIAQRNLNLKTIHVDVHPWVITVDA